MCTIPHIPHTKSIREYTRCYFEKLLLLLSCTVAAVAVDVVVSAVAAVVLYGHVPTSLLV